MVTQLSLWLFNYWDELRIHSRSLAGTKYTWQEVYRELDVAILEVIDSQKTEKFGSSHEK